MEDLLSLSLDRLEKEPELLASEAKRLQGQLLVGTPDAMRFPSSHRAAYRKMPPRCSN